MTGAGAGAGAGRKRMESEEYVLTREEMVAIVAAEFEVTVNEVSLGKTYGAAGDLYFDTVVAIYERHKKQLKNQQKGQHR